MTNRRLLKPAPPLNRREFIATSGRGVAVAALFSSVLQACGVGPSERSELDSEEDDWNGVACRKPTTVEQETFLAIADTVVPGATTDPSGTPGAVEGCVMNLASDPGLPVAGVVSFLVLLADQRSEKRFERPFLELSLQERTELLTEIAAETPLLSYAFRFFRAAHYAGMYNDVGPRSLGYPGGNLGYIDDDDFSFGEAVCREKTSDGNMP